MHHRIITPTEFRFLPLLPALFLLASCAQQPPPSSPAAMTAEDADQLIPLYSPNHPAPKGEDPAIIQRGQARAATLKLSPDAARALAEEEIASRSSLGLPYDWIEKSPAWLKGRRYVFCVNRPLVAGATLTGYFVDGDTGAVERYQIRSFDSSADRAAVAASFRFPPDKAFALLQHAAEYRRDHGFPSAYTDSKPAFLYGRCYVFLKPAKVQRLPAQGFFVNGDTGETQWRSIR